MTDGGEFGRPLEFLRTQHSKANKAGDIEDVFSDLEAAKKLHDRIGNFPFAPKKGTAEAAQMWGEDALNFFKGAPLKKRIGSLKVIRVRVTKAETNKKFAKESKAALKTIGDKIDDVVASVDISTITPQINTIMKGLVEADKEFVLNSLTRVFKSSKDCAARKHPEIVEAAKELAKWNDDLEESDKNKIRVAVANQLTDACRDVTQNLQNRVKAFGYGADILGLEPRDKATLPKVAKTLIPIANNKGSLFDGMDKAQMAQVIRTVKVNADLSDDISSRLP